MKISLIGNPNTGKTSLFNKLTGLNQQVVNYPGSTVEKKYGHFTLKNGTDVTIADLPGTYTLEPSSLDEVIVLKEILFLSEDIDLFIVVVDASSIKRNLYIFSQILDIGRPVLMVLNMLDIAKSKGLKVDIEKLKKELNTDIIPINASKGNGIDDIKDYIAQNIFVKSKEPVFDSEKENPEFIEDLKPYFKDKTHYFMWLYCVQQNLISENIPMDIRSDISGVLEKHKRFKFSIRESIKRYQRINDIIKKTVNTSKSEYNLTDKIDASFTHKFYGYIIFFTLLIFIFQCIFSWASYPMDMIDSLFSNVSETLKSILPENSLSNLITEGIIPGISGVIIFIPQIAILFFFISVLEQTGYMSRVVFLLDKFMRKFNLNGKSVVPMISGVACSIPAIMATRNIETQKERLLTIMIVPFMTCSARLPVYAILIGLAVPDKFFFGFNLQGLVLMAMYLVGFFTALIAALILDKFVRSKVTSLFLIEMPSYKIPQISNIFYTVVEKTKSFVVRSGKIIFSISILLWVLGSYGYSDNAHEIVAQQVKDQNLSEEELSREIESYKLENSYIGKMGKFIEPIISPLGYDWKIGIAIITSFSAREVFVGTLTTIYSIGDTEDSDLAIRQRLKKEKNPKTNKPIFSNAVCASLLIFYAFSMQCMSTVAVVRKETNSWKWAIFQVIFMTIYAYISAWITYNIFLLF
ncbi:ferrous iron transport protein B [Ichthyobacterium seriolicida]|uniref:Ferrous iron transport protein B n=1 Tax=Ichthyobacterium seriolicida TaxID=242600 RepID=A0A1J1ED13_9FLAO|nr:ferrous iron transport protein B [Ichthyobacterium seriolicida]BAV95408.1 ferrous iron transport protein B [Ichthyobacterium seriolicida]